MKKDPIHKLVKEASLETSPDFTDSLLQTLEQGIQKRLQVRLYVLIGTWGLLLVLGVYTLISLEFRLEIWGISVHLPEILTLVLLGMLGNLMTWHLLLLLRLGRGRHIM